MDGSANDAETAWDRFEHAQCEGWTKNVMVEQSHRTWKQDYLVKWKLYTAKRIYQMDSAM